MSGSIVLFDIDGTLLASAGAGKAALEKSMATHFGVDRMVDGLSLSGRTDRAILEDLFRLHEIPFNQGNYETMRQGYLAHLPTCLKSVEGKVLPGILSLLDTLEKRTDCAIGLLTGNLREGAKIKLGHFGIGKYFSFGGFGDRHLHRDDVAREALEEIKERFGNQYSLERTWVVGDTPLDIGCARAIGARVAAVATGWHGVEELAAYKPDMVLSDLADPNGFLAGALAV